VEGIPSGLQFGMDQWREGLYDAVVTRRVREILNNPPDVEARSLLEEMEESDRPEYLARHLVRQIKLALRSLPKEDRTQKQIELANSILRHLDADDAEAIAAEPASAEAQVLRAIYRGTEPPIAPTTPLSVSNLLMNAVDEPRLGFELERELATSDRVLMIVSFVQWRGWQRLRNAFLELAARRVPVQILTTTYLGATDLEAIRQLARLPNVELRISLDGRRRRLHAKAWLFQRDNGFSSVYVGSANLSGPALEDGIEWTVKLSEVEAPHIVTRFRGAFDSLWFDAEFVPFRPDDAELCQRVKQALAFAQQGPSSTRGAMPVFFDLRPHPFQQATLDRLEMERLDRGSFRNLVVAPTGTGKTLVAAFDYQRQPYAGLRPRLLFLAHREELLRQARDRFRHVLRDESFGELLGAGEEPSSYHYLFATIQSFRSRGLLASEGADFWEYIVLDEAHHAAAESYRETIAALRPRILLGLTATPERMDGESILPWFGGRMADEMRLWNAIELQYLVPFEYYGIHDGTDLRALSWRRGGYAIGELESRYLGDSRRAQLVASQFCEIYGNGGTQARAVGFCVSIEHAEYMAQEFRRVGIAAEAVTSATPGPLRATAPLRLRTREVNVLFTVDLFNEGIDIPEIDCVLFLRPTESSTIFLQQLGRGLRLDTGKKACLVLDFIGQQRSEFRFDLRFMTLFGGTRQQVIRELETGITRLPGNCYFRLDKESRKIVLGNLQARLRSSRVRMVAELQSLAAQLGRRPTLAEYLAETRYDLTDIYKKSAPGWTTLLLEAGLLEPPPTGESGALTKQFHLLLHIDSPVRLALYRSLLAETTGSPAELAPAEQRMGQMLTYRLLTKDELRQGPCAWQTGVERLRASPAAAAELRELSEVLQDRARTHVDERPLLANCPLFLHRQYVRDEVLIGLGMAEQVGSRASQTGCFWIERLNTEVFFVTLDKSDKSFSPTTRYEDFAVSPTRFHWQSQSRTTEHSTTGTRYIRQREMGTQFLLFVRPRKEEPFLLLGPLQYVSHRGNRPMSIYWDLQYPMPAWFFDRCAALRAA
jgi:superfamily II DNA or RNA helicase/HKD family nuclease